MNTGRGWIRGGLVLGCAVVAAAALAGCRAELAGRFDALQVGAPAPAEPVAGQRRVGFGWAEDRVRWCRFPAWGRVEAVRVLHDSDGTVVAKRMLFAEGAHGGLCRSYSVRYVFEARIPEDVFRDPPADWKTPEGYETRSALRVAVGFLLAMIEYEAASAREQSGEPSTRPSSRQAEPPYADLEQMTLGQAMDRMRSELLDIMLRGARHPEKMAIIAEAWRQRQGSAAQTRPASAESTPEPAVTIPPPSNTLEYMLLLDEVMRLLPRAELDPDLGAALALADWVLRGMQEGASLLGTAAGHPEAFRIADAADGAETRLDADGIPFTVRRLPDRRVQVEFRLGKCEPAFFGLEDNIREQNAQTVDPKAVEDMKLQDVQPVEQGDPPVDPEGQ